MNRQHMLDHWKDAIAKGTFLTSKHDPASVGTVHPKFRTVTVMSAPEIKTFIDSGDYSLRLFRNAKQPQSPDYIEIIPKDSSMVAGSGVQAHSPVPTTACDRFVAVSGVQQGWHLFAEQSATIQQKQHNGDLSYICDLL